MQIWRGPGSELGACHEKVWFRARCMTLEVVGRIVLVIVRIQSLFMKLLYESFDMGWLKVNIFNERVRLYDGACHERVRINIGCVSQKGPNQR